MNILKYMVFHPVTGFKTTFFINIYGDEYGAITVYAKSSKRLSSFDDIHEAIDFCDKTVKK